MILMSVHQDIRGYYHVLGVHPSATSDQIKKAFRSRARDYHPDRNGLPNATQQFQFLNEAFQALNDPERRARYDAECYNDVTEAADERVEPIRCSVCNRVSAQPRYAIYYQVISFLFFTRRQVHQGIYCSECGGRQAYKASLITWFFGWWGLPWGPIYSAHALFHNAFGGEHPSESNFRVLSFQAFYFASIERRDLASQVAADALSMVESIASYNGNFHTPRIRRLMYALNDLRSAGNELGCAKLPRRWGIGSKLFYFQSIPVALLIAAVASALSVGNDHRTHRPTLEVPVAEVQPFNETPLPLPLTGYLSDPSGNILRAPLKIVTSPNSPNYYIKVVQLGSNTSVLTVFVRSGESASVRVPLGEYEVRYAAGEYWYGEAMRFGPKTLYRKLDESFVFRKEADRVLGYTVELIQQLGGNLKEIAISPGDF